MKFQVMPPLSETDYEALKADIAERGVLIPIDVDEDGNVLDGHHRLAIARELGIDCPKFKRIGLGSDEDKRTHARALNIARRHLDSKQKRELIAAELKDDPERSNRQIGEALGVDKNTVTSVRQELEGRGEIHHVSTITDTAGRQQPSRKPTKTILIDDDDTVKDSAKNYRAAKTTATKARNEETAARKMAAPEGRYGTLVIDPPWPMEKVERDERPNQIGFDYPTMDETALREFGGAVNAAAHDNAHLFMWTTHKFLPMSLRLLEVWGWKYVLTMVWHKPGGFQPFGLPQYNCEFCVYARRGAPVFRETKAFPTCFEAPRGAHSEKPDAFYDMIRRVTHDGRIDIFNRRQIDGFTGWGNESCPT